jgi:hypothetical protein
LALIVVAALLAVVRVQVNASLGLSHSNLLDSASTRSARRKGRSIFGARRSARFRRFFFVASEEGENCQRRGKASDRQSHISDVH